VRRKLSKPDPELQEKWDQILHDHHLGMNQGRHSKKLAYVGSSTDLEVLASYRTEETNEQS
jgi:hypothetical protein